MTDGGRGAFVVMVGPDGVGKTTVARNLIGLHDGPTAYFHFRPPLFGAMATGPPDGSAPAIDKGRATGWRALGWLRLLRTFLHLWIVHLTTVLPAIKRGTLVVGDRWVYPYLVQPHAVRFYGPRQLASLAIRALPRPDMVVNLTAPRDLILTRKAELTADQIERELVEWTNLPRARLRTFETVGDAQEVARSVLAELQAGEARPPGHHKRFPPRWDHLLVPTSSRRAALAGLSLYTACRPGPLLVLRLVRVTVGLAGPRILPGPSVSWVPPLLPDVWADLLVRWRLEIGHFDDVAIYRPRQLSRTGFATLLLEQGKPMAFVKVRVGQGANLENERRALEHIVRRRADRFHVGDPRSWGEIGPASYLALAPLPPFLHQPPPGTEIEAILEDVQAGLAELPRLPGTPAHWVPMHGDFTPWNLRRFRKCLYLIDWEDAGWGPPGADEVLYRATSLALRREARGLGDAAEARAFWAEQINKRLERAEQTGDADRAMLERLAGILQPDGY